MNIHTNVQIEEKHKPLKSARARYIQTVAKEQCHTAWSENTKTAAALQRIMKGKHMKTGPTLYNEITNRNAAAKSHNCGQALRIKLLPLSIWHQEHTILQMRTWKGNSGILPPGVSKLLRTKEQLRREVGIGTMRVETRKTTKDDKAHAGIYQGNR